jgi:integrase
MPHAHLVKDSNPSRFQGQVRLAHQPSKSKTFGSYTDAWNWSERVEKELKAAMAKAATAVVPPPQGGDLTGEELQYTLHLYAASKACNDRNKKSVATLVRFIGAITISQANDHWAELFLDEMRDRKPRNKSKPYAEATLKKLITAVNMAIDWRARRLNILRPGYRIDMKLINKNRDVIRDRRLDDSEWRRMRSRLRLLRAASGRHFRCLAWMALATGARLDEILDMPWSEVDLDSKRWYLAAHRTKASKGRTIPLNKRAVRVLKVLKRDADENNPRIFHRLGDAHSLSTRFWTLTREAKVVNFKFHDYRHEAIVRFVIRAKSLGAYTKIMKIVGHKDYETFDRYITFKDEEFDNVLD